MRDDQPVGWIIGGTAAYSIKIEDFATVIEIRTIDTPFGASPRFAKIALPSGASVWFSSRHGETSLSRTARFVNHRANIWAARALGVRWVLSWNGVGAINHAYRVGDVAVPAGLLDWTRNRIDSFGAEIELDSTAMKRAGALRADARTIGHIRDGRAARQHARPFDPRLRAAVRASVQNDAATLPIADAVYVCTEGPRLETAAEIDFAEYCGADVVSMSLCPEVWLAAELGIAYASLCVITNFATGRWTNDPRREFGAPVAARALTLLLHAAADLSAGEVDP